MKYQRISFLFLVLLSNPTYAIGHCENEQVLNELKETIKLSFTENLEEYLDRRDKLEQKFSKVLWDKFVDEMRASFQEQADSQKIRQAVIHEFWSINQKFERILSEYISGKTSESKLKSETGIFIKILEKENAFEANQQYETILKVVNEAKSLHQYKLFMAQLDNDNSAYVDEFFSSKDYDLIDHVIEKHLDFSLSNVQQVNEKSIVGGKLYQCNSTLLLQSKAFSFQFSTVNDGFSHLESKIDNKPLSNKKLGDFLIKGSKPL